MFDPRLDKLAQVLVSYSTAVKPGELVRINGSTVAEPLAVAICRAVIKAGAHAHVRLVPDECAEIKLNLANEAQLLYEDPLELEAVDRCDVSIGIWAQENTKSLSGTDPKRQALVSQGARAT